MFTSPERGRRPTHHASPAGAFPGCSRPARSGARPAGRQGRGVRDSPVDPGRPRPVRQPDRRIDPKRVPIRCPVAPGAAGSETAGPGTDEGRAAHRLSGDRPLPCRWPASSAPARPARIAVMLRARLCDALCRRSDAPFSAPVSGGHAGRAAPERVTRTRHTPFPDGLRSAGGIRGDAEERRPQEPVTRSCSGFRSSSRQRLRAFRLDGL